MVETSMFGNKFIAMKMAAEQIESSLALLFRHTLTKPCMTLASIQQEPIQMSGDDQPKKLMVRNTMNIFCAMLMTY